MGRQVRTSTLVCAILLLLIVALVGFRAGTERTANFEKKCAEMAGRIEGNLCLAPNGDVIIRNS